MHFCTLIVAAFIVISGLPASAKDDGDETPSPELCSISNLENIEGIEKAIFYVITPDCRFYAWRNGFIPRNDEVGLNGTKHIIQTHATKKIDRLGPFVMQMGLSKKCATESGAFVFGHREGEGRPELVFMTRYEPGNYVLLRIPVEEYLETATHTHKNLIAMFEESGIMVNTTQKLSTCTFYKDELQCFWLSNENELHMMPFEKYTHAHTKKDEYRPLGQSILGTLENRRMVDQMASLYESGPVASVYMYDALTDGWLYRWNDAERTATNSKLINLNTIPKMENHLASLAILDRATMILTKCDTVECYYYWASLQIESKTPSTCLFLSKLHTISGVITDVRLPEVVPDAEAQIASTFLLFMALADHPYWPVILLVVVSVLIFLLVLVCAFVYESFGFKKRLVVEKVMDTKYARIFWPNNGDIVSLTLSDIETAEAASSQALATIEAENGQIPAAQHTSSSSMPLQSPPMTSRLLFTEEENKTASSLRHSSPINPKIPVNTTPKNENFTSASSHPGFVNIRYATHQPPVLNPRKAPDARKSRITPAIVDVAPSPAARKDDKKEDDALASVKVEPLKEDQQLVDAPYTPATLQSRARKASKAKRQKRRARTPRGTEMEIDRTQQSEKGAVGSVEPSRKRLASEEPFKLSVRDPKTGKSVASRKSQVSREPVALIEPKRARPRPRIARVARSPSPMQDSTSRQSISSTQASASKKRPTREALPPTDVTQPSVSSKKKPQPRNAGTPTQRSRSRAAPPGTKYYSVQGGKPEGTKYYSVQGGKPEGTKYYSVQGPKPAGTKYYSVQTAPPQEATVEKAESTYVSASKQPNKSNYGSAKTSIPKNSQYLGRGAPSTAQNKSMYGAPFLEKSHDSTDLRTASSRSKRALP
uniref:Uncharacterized protein n=1 Tax=Panagrellus redivivus TaxID=6233 RepID=A0A7E4UZ99_PANRE